MKALTVSQPFASLIASGAKWVENRNWPTPYRGPLLVHAGARSKYLAAAELRRYPTGVAIATCQLIGCVELAAIHREETAAALAAAGLDAAAILAHEHTHGPWCWILADAQVIQPVAASGRLGLWECDAPTIAIDPADAALGPLVLSGC